jgi:hypothetical protein
MALAAVAADNTLSHSLTGKKQRKLKCSSVKAGMPRNERERER